MGLLKDFFFKPNVVNSKNYKRFYPFSNIFDTTNL